MEQLPATSLLTEIFSTSRFSNDSSQISNASTSLQSQLQCILKTALTLNKCIYSQCGAAKQASRQAAKPTGRGFRDVSGIRSKGGGKQASKQASNNNNNRSKEGGKQPRHIGCRCIYLLAD